MNTEKQEKYRACTWREFYSSDGESYECDFYLHKIKKNLSLRVLSEEDWNQWVNDGYVIVRNAISAEHASKLFDFAWEFQGLKREDPASWYEEKSFADDLERELYIYGFIEAYHHQLIWDSRQSQRVYDAFVDIWDCEELWTTLDRLNLNPPNRHNRSRSLIQSTEKGFDINLHWDVDTSQTIPPQRVQGIIALNDTCIETGGFQCCPKLFNEFEQWRKKQPADRDPIRPSIDWNEYPVIAPQLKAGDLLIFNGLLAHGVGENISDEKVRSVQYLSMMPALETHHALRQSRINSWQNLQTPEWNKTLVGDSRLHESKRYGSASLNALGRKILGLDSWVEQNKLVG